MIARSSCVWVLILAGCSSSSMTNSNSSVPAPSITVTYPSAATVTSGWSSYFKGTCTSGAGDVIISGDVSAAATCVNGEWSISVDLSSRPTGATSLSITQTNSTGTSATSVTRTINKTNTSCDSSSVRSNSPFASGTGANSSNPFIICTATQLANVPAGDLTKFYKIASDIDLSSVSMAKIGTAATMFTGAFDGGGFRIYNFSLNVGVDYVGFFGYVDAGANITDVHLVDVNIQTTGSTAGGLIGIIDSAATVARSSVTGRVSGVSQVGGFIGLLNFGTITKSFANVTVVATDVSGGFVGQCDTNGSIDNSYSLGAVSGTDYIGGFVGVLWGTVSQSYAAGLVTATSTNRGGFAGDAVGTLTQNYWDKQTTGYLTSSGSGAGLAEGKTTTEMYTQSTFSGFSFPATWKAMTGSTYPQLTWQP